MEKQIIRDIIFLKRRSQPAGISDASVGDDLADTLKANRERCAGLAANMIGISKRIIVIQTPLAPVVMFNPKIVSHSAESYEAEEGCLSLEGVRKTTRYNEIEVEFQDICFQRQKKTFSDLTAQIIQHEMDHLEGILI